MIDAGNTHLKWCWYDGKNLPPRFYSATYGELERQGVNLFKNRGVDAENVLICNVAGKGVEQTLISGFTHWSLEPRFFTSKAQGCGVTNAYIEPEQLGADRWMALIGVWSLKQTAACIVDCGTAVTIDALNDQGQHMGGMIVPGLALMQDSLSKQTSGISPDGDIEQDGRLSSPLACNTSSAIAAGTRYALVALIDRVRADVKEELGLNLPLYLSGGSANLIRPLLSCKNHYAPMLIFQGMIIADKDASY